ncbi:MAG: hypothetical protein Satyrvirus27_5 [Satyrvirus sp.]|uniref:N-acetyltransferase domain-containing protein n=1 Tax=Satyrvirus sp. TaxID=2487771 RepID=A0A3G5AER8_9VIRU|nr:MAG: hypothetical protein Satyrvirus27_5 [Satyrvirus sp.]
MDSCDFVEEKLHIRIRKMDIENPSEDDKKIIIKAGGDYSGICNMWGPMVAIFAKIINFVAPNKFYEILMQMRDLKMKDFSPQDRVLIGYIIEDPLTGNPIGAISVSNYDGEIPDNYVGMKLLELGLYIFPEYRGKGYTKTFYRKVLEYIISSNSDRETFGNATFCFITIPTNIPMKHVANLLGATYIQQVENIIDFAIYEKRIVVDIYFLLKSCNNPVWYANVSGGSYKN